MDIDTFVAGSQATILAFKTAYKQDAQTDPTFHAERTELDWWCELVAYMMYVEIDDQFKRGGEN